MQWQTVAIVGVGLIGGSIGLAARRRGLARCIRGVGWRQHTLDVAHERGAIDEGHLQLAPAVAGADLVVFCTPVQAIPGQILEAAAHARPGAVFTDAGSTKEQIVAAVEGRLPDGVHFVGSHPLAGSEKRGPEHADARLFQNRLTVLTPTAATDPEALRQVRVFWEALGSRVKEMSPQAHDQALALTSHVPHLLASVLAGVLPEEWHGLTATGFRDTTRIAAGDPHLWTGIFLQNRAAVLAALARFAAHLDRFQSAVVAGDEATLMTLLDQAKKVRDALGS
jgi:prephenate dehydrogenase